MPLLPEEGFSGGSRDVDRSTWEGRESGGGVYTNHQGGTAVGGDEGLVYALVELNDSVRPAPPRPSLSRPVSPLLPHQYTLETRYDKVMEVAAAEQYWRNLASCKEKEPRSDESMFSAPS
ncbi:hypothetical protein E2C01_059498 [Portunus trituberculatus]|uniref:Uncharacterized protein n=1 Tax=Portunus trituberculatus TaxID=210409 RepID=A0A5B7H985_PORTR|nr:hypothetical protein [Portunus trituberculatus]